MEYDIEINQYGTKCYYIKGTRTYHREDGPAIENIECDKLWYIKGMLHRTDGPAIERANGYRAWYTNGKRHRTDGPAVEYANGNASWWFDGKSVSPEKEAILNKWWNNKNGK